MGAEGADEEAPAAGPPPKVEDRMPDGAGQVPPETAGQPPRAPPEETVSTEEEDHNRLKREQAEEEVFSAPTAPPPTPPLPPPPPETKPHPKTKVGFVHDPAMEKHAPPTHERHPECPERHAVVASAMRRAIGDRCVAIPARSASDMEILTAHSKAYVEELKSSETGSRRLRSRLERNWKYDVYVNSHTWAAARLSLGCACEATRRVASGELSHALACIRPPGHHACPSHAMGFCFFNNAATCARLLVDGGLENPGACRVANNTTSVEFDQAERKVAQKTRPTKAARRVLIVDWDVHHGNGTQDMTYDDPRILYFSVHRGFESRRKRGAALFYPGTGFPKEIGTTRARGFNANVAWSEPGMGDAEYYHCWDRLLLPLARAFAPDVILISAGFDAARGDPLGECEVTPRAYFRMTKDLKEIAPCVLLLEGGYNLDVIGKCFSACAAALLGDLEPPASCSLAKAATTTTKGDDGDGALRDLTSLADELCDPGAAADVHATVKALAPHWPALVRRHRELSERGSDRFLPAEDDLDPLICEMTGITLDDGPPPETPPPALTAPAPPAPPAPEPTPPGIAAEAATSVASTPTEDAATHEMPTETPPATPEPTPPGIPAVQKAASTPTEDAAMQEIPTETAPAPENSA